MLRPVKAANAAKEIICRIVMEQDRQARARVEARGAGPADREASREWAKAQARARGKELAKESAKARERGRARGAASVVASVVEKRPGTGALRQGPGPLG